VNRDELRAFLENKGHVFVLINMAPMGGRYRCKNCDNIYLIFPSKYIPDFYLLTCSEMIIKDIIE